MENSQIIFLYEKKALSYDGKDIKAANFKDSKNFFTASFIPHRYLTSLTFKMPKNLSNEELESQIEIKMYNEAGLDPNKDYSIDSIKYDMGEEYIVEGIALSKDSFDKEFKFYEKKVEAIDLLFPRFLSYQVLYNKELDKNRNDLFIFIGEQEAFGAIYKNGEYIGHRTIDSLSTISKKLGIEISKLKEYLSSKGLNKENYSLEEIDIFDSLQDIFLKNIEKLIYSINHKRSFFGLAGIDRVIVDFDGKEIDGLKDFFIPNGYEDIEIEKLKCCSRDDEKARVFLFCEYAYEIVNSAKNLQKINLTFLERKKPLYEYTAIKYIAIFFLAILITFGLYGYFMYKSNLLDEKISQKNSKLKRLKLLSSKYIKKFQKLKKENEQIISEIKNLEHQEFVYDTTLKMIPFLESQKTKREKFVNDVVLILAKYRLNTQHIRQKDSKEMDVLIISKTNQRDKIAKFINDILKKGYLEAKTDEIVYENGIYKSSIRIKR